jgi:hypothetical protein
MKLTRGQALELHWQMWADMQKELGDNPSFGKRWEFKAKWCAEHFPGEEIVSNCFLCEYVNQNEYDCDSCPIKWDNDPVIDCCESGSVNYVNSPISVILALPEREVDDGQAH